MVHTISLLSFVLAASVVPSAVWGRTKGALPPTRVRSETAKRAIPSGISPGGTCGDGNTTCITILETTINGFYDSSSNQDHYFGIPFASNTPRFEEAVAFNFKVSQTLNATSYSPACPQTLGGSWAGSSALGYSEDCLKLDIYAPHGLTSASKLPVFVWIYGGGFYEGATSAYDATPLVTTAVNIDTPVIVVAISYRVGPFGFFAGTEATSNGALNLGIKDQTLALEWISNYISYFGGDPDKVVIGGQSAGSISAGIHLLDESQSLFRGVIMQSGSPDTLPLSPSEYHESVYSLMLSYSGCSTWACLKTADLDVMVEAQAEVLASPGTHGIFPFGPVYDSEVITDSPRSLITEGRFSKVPFIAGDVLDEGTYFSSTSVDTETEMMEYFSLIYAGTTAEKADLFYNNATTTAGILAAYPDDPALGSPFGTGDDLFGKGTEFKRGAAIYGDVGFNAPRRFLSSTATAAGVNVWSYRLDRNVLQNTAYAYLGVYHTLDLQYLFGTVSSSDTVGTELGENMRKYWMSFAANLNPNPPDGTLLSWPLYGTELNMISLNNTNVMTTDDARKNSTDYLLSIPAIQFDQ